MLEIRENKNPSFSFTFTFPKPFNKPNKSKTKRPLFHTIIREWTEILCNITIPNHFTSIIMSANSKGKIIINISLQIFERLSSCITSSTFTFISFAFKSMSKPLASVTLDRLLLTTTTTT